MQSSFKKMGLKVLIFTILALILMGQLNVPNPWPLTLGTFGFGTGIFLIFFGGMQPPEDL